MKYAGLQGHMYGFLQRNVWARERRNKDKAIVIALYEKNLGYPKSPQELVEFVKDHESASRYWRLLLRNHPEIQGKDYNDKDKYEQQFEINVLGREIHHDRDVKRLAQIV